MTCQTRSLSPLKLALLVALLAGPVAGRAEDVHDMTMHSGHMAAPMEGPHRSEPMPDTMATGANPETSGLHAHDHLQNIHGLRSGDYSDGYGFGPMGRHAMADDMRFGAVIVDRLEKVQTRDHSLTAFDLRVWYGKDYDRMVFKSEGEVDAGRLRDARSELLWGHAIAPFWDAQLGWRHDAGVMPARDWLALGIEGLAPYWFDVEAALYLGASGRTALRVDASYDLLLTQRIILQPRFGANFRGRGDPGRDIGSGFSDATLGLRLRYEFRRELAPYIGVEWSGKYGETADLARAAGEREHEARIVAGVRFWF